MRILHLVHQYPPDYLGGTELYTQTLAAAQAREGHTAAVFVPIPGEVKQGLQRGDEAGVVIYRIPVGERSRAQVFWQVFRQPELRRAWRLVLAEFAPDVVHIQHLMGLPLDMVADLGVARVPYVVTLHDYWYLCANAQLVTNTDDTICAGPDVRALNCARCALARGGLRNASMLAAGLAPVMKRRNESAAGVLRGAAQVIAPTAFVKNIYNLAGLADDSVTVIAHGLDLPIQQINLARRARRQRKGSAQLHIGYVGSIGYQKGLHVLIAAVNGLPVGDVHLTIYGDLTVFPDYTAELRQLASHPGISFAGIVARDELWPALSDFDVVVLPTLWYEASPLVIDEVFAAGIPIIGSRIGAVVEKVSDGRNGRLFEPGNVDELRAILEELLAARGQLAEWERAIPQPQSMAGHMKAIEEVYAAALDSV